jgi:hypothetical protein
MYQGKNLRRALLAISDIDRSQSYEFRGEPPMPDRHYRAIAIAFRPLAPQ